MISLDGNVIFAVLTPDEIHHERARQLLREANPRGLRLSLVVYAELMASSEQEAHKLFLERARLEVGLPPMPSIMGSTC